MGRIIHCDFQKNSTTKTSLGPVKFDERGNAEVDDKMAEKLLTVKGYTQIGAQNNIPVPPGPGSGVPDDTPSAADLIPEEIKQRQIAELGNKEIDELKQLAASLEIQIPAKTKKKEEIMRLIVESGKLPQTSATAQ